MTDSYRKERISRLFQELKYEIERGMMEGEIEESMGYTFIVPISRAIPNGVVRCEFRARPMPGYLMAQPRLKVV